MKKFFISLTIGIMLIGGLLVVHAEARARDCVKEWNACMDTLNGDRSSCEILWRYCHKHIA